MGHTIEYNNIVRVQIDYADDSRNHNLGRPRSPVLHRVKGSSQPGKKTETVIHTPNLRIYISRTSPVAVIIPVRRSSICLFWMTS